MEAIAAIVLIALALLPVHFLVFMTPHAIGFFAVSAILIVLYGLYLRKVYRNAKSHPGSR